MSCSSPALPHRDGDAAGPRGLIFEDILANLNPRQVEAVRAPPDHSWCWRARAAVRRTSSRAEQRGWSRSRAPSPAGALHNLHKQAAQEMRERLVAMLGDAASDVWVYTYHGLAVRILRRHAALLGLDPFFAVADQGTQIELVTEIVRSRNLSLEQYTPRQVLDFIGQHQRVWPTRQLPSAKTANRPRRAAGRAAAAYVKHLRARNLLDFDDLIVSAVQVLREGPQRPRGDPTIAPPHLLVDEYQDINRAQFEMLKLLAPQVTTSWWWPMPPNPSIAGGGHNPG